MECMLRGAVLAAPHRSRGGRICTSAEAIRAVFLYLKKDFDIFFPFLPFSSFPSLLHIVYLSVGGQSICWSYVLTRLGC